MIKKLLILLILASCTLVKVADVGSYNKNLRKNLATTEIGLRKIDNELDSLAYVSQRMKDSEINVRLAKLNQSKNNILQSYIRLKEDFENSKFKNKKKITSKDKQYPQLLKQQKDFENRFDILKKQFEAYRLESNSLRDYLNSKNVFQLDIVQLRKDFQNVLNRSYSAREKVRTRLATLDSPKNRTTLTQMKSKLKDIDGHISKIEGLYQSILNKVGEQEVTYIFPGMDAHNYIMKIKARSDAIAQRVSEFNQLSQRLTP